MEVYTGLLQIQRLTIEAVRLAAQSTSLATAERQPLPPRNGDDTLRLREERRLRAEEEIEQLFDNMPV